MAKLAEFLVEQRKWILGLFLIFTVISAWASTQVNVNMDMTYYLPADSYARRGAEIMEEEFDSSGLVHVMFEGLTEADQERIYLELSEVYHVDTVNFNPESDQHVNGDYSLFVVMLNVDIFSDEAQVALDAIGNLYADYDTEIISAAGSPVDIMTIAIPAILILLVILFAMCHSWFEAVIILINIGIAVVLNMGTNIIFSSVSDITMSIVAILQLVLSIDYSVILLDRYRYEKHKVPNKYTAMKITLQNSFSTIMSIGFTTIVGMVMLVFLSFTIGRDLGFVLAKGVFFSLICIFTVMPALVLMFDEFITKTEKPILPMPMKGIGTFCYKARWILMPAFLVLFGVTFATQGNIEITYSEAAYNPVHINFDLDNAVVVVYENADEENMASFIAEWENHAHIVDINAYATTIGTLMTAVELAEEMDMAVDDIQLLFGLYTLENSDVEVVSEMPVYDFLNFIVNDVAVNPQFSDMFKTEEIEQLEALLDSTELLETAAVVPLEQLAPMLEMDPMELGMILYFAEIIEAREDMIAEDMAEIMDMQTVEVEQLFQLYTLEDIETVEEIVLHRFVMFIAQEVITNPDFAEVMNDADLQMLEEAVELMEEGRDQLVGNNYSRLIINTNLDIEGEETFAFIEFLRTELDSQLDGEFFLVGESAIAYEMSLNFPNEFTTITILTAFAFFFVAAAAFRSLSVSAILVFVIQGSVYITLASTAITGGGIMYLALIIAQCLLKSRVIDYGILYTANYIESRAQAGVKEATISALNNSIHTIMTSGLIMIIMTAAVGIGFMGINDAISEILLLVALGCFIGVVLTIFVLPALTAVFDKLVYKPGKSRKISH